MMTSTSYIPMPAPRRNWLPLTLLAALLVVAIDGIMLINGIGKSPTPNEVALAQPTVTPTTPFPTEVPTETVVPNTRVSSDSPGERVAIGIPLSSLTSDSLVPGVGGSVDIVALLPSKPANLNINTIASTLMPDGSRIIETMLIRDTIVLYHGAWPQTNPTDQSSTITFAVTPQDSRMLAWLAEQPQVTFRLQQPLNNVFDLPSDSKMIDIPFDNVTAEENIHPGDKVDVFSTCALVPDVTGINNTVISSKTDCTQPEEVKRASNAIVFIGEIVVTGRQPVITYQGMSLSVAPEIVPLFTQLLDAKMHFKLVKSTTSNQHTPVPLPTGKVSVDNLPTNIPGEIALAQPTVTTNT